MTIVDVSLSWLLRVVESRFRSSTLHYSSPRRPIVDVIFFVPVSSSFLPSTIFWNKTTIPPLSLFKAKYHCASLHGSSVCRHAIWLVAQRCRVATTFVILLVSSLCIYSLLNVDAPQVWACLSASVSPFSVCRSISCFPCLVVSHSSVFIL